MRILITGCHLHDVRNNQFAYGDLYQVNSSYVLVANRDEERDTMWRSTQTNPQNPRILVCAGELFDMRGVLICAVHDATLNDAAKIYLHGDRTVPL